MATPRTDWRERIEPGEDARWERLAAQLRDAPRRPAGAEARALHTKGSAGVRAVLTVPSDVPPEARVGIFAAPGTYKAYARISNGSAMRQADAVHDVRGFALKVLGVPGRKLLPGLEEATTQDFLTIRNPMAPFRGPDEFVWVACASLQPWTFLPRALLHLGPRRALDLIGTLKRNLATPYPSAAVSTFYSALAIRVGSCAARYSIAAEDASTPDMPASPTSDLVHDDLRDRLARGPIHYQLRLQYWVDEVRTPIEDAGVEWKASDSPYVPVARITLPAQELDTEAGRRVAAFVEQLSFDPWHAPVEFQPLGSMMRARRAAYRASTRARGAAAEPVGTDWIA